MMRSDVTSGPLATSNVAWLEAWRGCSLVICHDRNQDHDYYDIFCNPIVGNKTKPRQCDIALKKKKMSTFYLPLFYLIVFS